ncbi:MAG TPA: tyrosine-type recombinase/integrase [Gemmatimonadaceae bacterium]|nr:tyrosine-type recombinase/integrase [Gemmatimonadaceae bacterium]
MKRWRTSTTGCFRFNRDFSRLGVGRITISSRTTNAAEFERRNAILTKLAESAQVEVLRGLRDGRISIEQLVESDRQGKLTGAELLPELLLLQGLWPAVDATLPKMGRSARTRSRYQTSFYSLQIKAADQLGDNAAVRDLAKVNWRALRAAWGGSGADWNHLRRAVSAFLTQLLGEKYHPFRLKLMRDIPRAAEQGRVPDLSPEAFERVLKKMQPEFRSIFRVLVLTGMRVGEYLNCTHFSLKPDIHGIDVPGTKTAGSAATVYVAAGHWKHVQAAIPCPLGDVQPVPEGGVQYDPRYKRLRRLWIDATRAAGVSVRLHDLRHCTAQWAINSGVPEAMVQVAMRHKTAGMTRRYAMQKESRAVAEALGKLMAKRPAKGKAS